MVWKSSLYHTWWNIIEVILDAHARNEEEIKNREVSLWLNAVIAIGLDREGKKGWQEIQLWIERE